MKSDTSSLAQLRSAVLDYAAGVEDRFGGSELTTLLAVMKAQGIGDRALISDFVAEILTADDLKHHDRDRLLLAIVRIVQEFDLKDDRIAEHAERLFTSDVFNELPRGAAYLVEIFISCGGDLTPTTLDRLSALRLSESKQWAHFAISNAYVGDVCALALALSGLLREPQANWKFDYLIDFIDDIRSIYTLGGLEIVFKEYVESINNKSEREQLYSFYQELTGRNFRPRTRIDRLQVVSSEGIPRQVFLPVCVSEILKSNPKRVESALNVERPSRSSASRENA